MLFEAGDRSLLLSSSWRKPEGMNEKTTTYHPPCTPSRPVPLGLDMLKLGLRLLQGKRDSRKPEAFGMMMGDLRPEPSV